MRLETRDEKKEYKVLKRGNKLACTDTSRGLGIDIQESKVLLYLFDSCQKTVQISDAIYIYVVAP